jgi:HK97 family phage major capsid protein
MNHYEELVKKQAEISTIVSTLAAENRTPNDSEKAQLDTLKGDVAAIKANFESEGRKAFLGSLETKQDKRVLLAKGESFESTVSFPDEHKRLSIGKLLRGWIDGDWTGAELEQKAMTSSPTTAGGMLIPTVLSSRIIDVARAKAAVFQAGATTVPMSSNNLKVARATQDISAAWYNPNAAIAESDMVFDSVDFTARKMGCLVRVENELLEDATGIDEAITNSIGSAIALELDRVGLLGPGVAPQPQGLYANTDVNAVAAFGVPADYAKFLTGYFNVVGYNFAPNAVIYNSRTAAKLASLVSGIAGDKTQLAEPKPWDAVTKYVSNQIPNANLPGATDSAAFLGEWRYLWVGLRRNILLEVSREAGDVFSKDQTLIRATWRGDVQLAQPKAFNKYTGIAP